MKTAVEVEGLTRRFGEFVAVDDVSFDGATGEVFGFLGPNGAGKTTTIKMLTGLLLPSAGTGRVAGFDLMNDTESIRMNIGYMSQAFSLYADLTVEENIAFFSGLYGVERSRRHQRRDWVLEMARLEDSRHRLVSQLSLGWKQRLALGCAVLHEPPVLFLDEPTSGVDPLSRRAFWDLIYELATAGTTVFVTTHYMEEAEYCNRLALMNRGRLIALDAPDALRSMMTTPLLSIDVEKSVRAIGVIERSEGVVDAGLYGRSIHATVADEERGRKAIIENLNAENLTIRSIERIEPSLEDVFVSLVRESGGAIDG